MMIWNLKFLIFVFIMIACTKKDKEYNEGSEAIYSIDETKPFQIFSLRILFCLNSTMFR